MELTITKKESGSEMTLVAKGRITTASALDLEKALIEAFENGFDPVILDMYSVELLTSTGIRVILKTFKAATEEGKKFRIGSTSEAVRNVLGLSNLEVMLKK